MSHRIINPPSVASPAGPYSQAISSSGQGSWLHIAGQIGVDAQGQLAQGFEAQAHQAWTNLVAVLAAADMTAADLVKVTTFLVDRSHLPSLGPVRSSFLGQARPASTLLIVQALAHPDWLFEVEAVAFKPSGA